MEAHAKTIRQILESGCQYLIPFFQRSYSWRKLHWKRLWADIMALATESGTNEHFLGPLVCTLANASPGEIPTYLLIDGQQRITTLTLLLAAMRDVARDYGDSRTADKIHESYLVHRHEEDLKHFKVLPRTGDREVLIQIIKDPNQGQKQSPLVSGYRFFYRAIQECMDSLSKPIELPKLLGIVADRLALVVITITAENPFEIFESLNSTGLPLEESDLIRNFLFMQVPLAKQEQFSKNYWNTFESMFEQDRTYSAKLATSFYRHYLMRDGDYSSANSTFVDFKKSNQARKLSPEMQVQELQRFARFELMLLRPDECDSQPLRDALTCIDKLDVSTAYPLLLNLLDRNAAGKLSEQDLIGCLTDLASFVLRRSICGDSTRAYGKWFVEAITCIKESVRSDLQNFWLRRGWPDDQAFLTQLSSFPIYRREPKKLRLMLETLEISLGHKEKVKFKDLQIEHVMPQKIGGNDAGMAWKKSLGEDWKQTHDQLLHTLGNLTLTGYNSTLSNRSYPWKQDEFAKSHVELNKWFKTVDQWTRAEIEHRSQELGQRIIKIWPRPTGPAYTPNPDFTEDTRKFFEEYWNGFLELIHAKSLPFIVQGRTSMPFVWVKGPRQSFWYEFFVDPVDRYLAMGLLTTGKRAKEYFSLLWNLTPWEDLEQIEKVLECELCLNTDNFEMYVEQLEIPVHDRSKWPEQHEWLAKAIVVFEERLCDHIRSISLSDYVPELWDEVLDCLQGEVGAEHSTEFAQEFTPDFDEED